MRPESPIPVLKILALVLLVMTGRTCAQLQFEPSQLDLGPMLQMETKVLELKIRNDSSGPLDPALFEFDCGCFKLTEPLIPVPAHETAVVQLEVHTGYFAGPHKKQVRWRHGEITAKADIAFQVTADFELSPQIQQLGVLRRGETREVSYLIKGREGLEAELILLQSPAAAVVELKRLDDEEKRRRWRLSLSYRVSEKARAGAFEEGIVLEARSARIPNLNLGIAGRVELELSASPSVIDFGRLVPGEAAVFNLQLKALDKQEFCVLGLGPRSELKLIDMNSEAATTQELRLELKKSLLPGSHRGFVDIRTNHRAEPLLRIAWRVRVIEDEK